MPTMSKLLKFLVVFSFVAACAPLSLYYRPGASVAQMQTDTTNCEVKALREAPVANQIRRSPPVYFPGTRYCDPRGRCYTSPGYWLDGPIYTVDVNASLRQRVTNQCMAEKGYRPASIPQCPQNVAAAAPAGTTTTLPTLTADSCVINNRDGTWQIVNAPG